jgi:hypothetical protein
MSGRDPLPDEAILVRGGRVPFARSLCLDCRMHPDGYFGFSVQSAAGMSVEDLARALPNGRVGFTTAGELRKMGYDVVPTSGDAFHATVVVPRDWGEAEALELAQSFRDAKNPNPKRAR